MASNNKLHMHNFLRRNKRLIKPYIRNYIRETDRAFFDIRVIDDKLKDILKEDWSEIVTHFRCWVIAETLMDIDKNLQWWSGKTHRILYRPTTHMQETAKAAI